MTTQNPDTAFLRQRFSTLSHLKRLIKPRPWGLFRLFRRQTDECTYSYILAYLLDPWNPHGLGAMFLEAFMGHVVGLSLGADFSKAEVSVFDKANGAHLE